LESTKSWRGCL